MKKINAAVFAGLMVIAGTSFAGVSAYDQQIEALKRAQEAAAKAAGKNGGISPSKGNGGTGIGSSNGGTGISPSKGNGGISPGRP